MRRLRRLALPAILALALLGAGVAGVRAAERIDAWFLETRFKTSCCASHCPVVLWHGDVYVCNERLR